MKGLRLFKVPSSLELMVARSARTTTSWSKGTSLPSINSQRTVVFAWTHWWNHLLCLCWSFHPVGFAGREEGRVITCFVNILLGFCWGGFGLMSSPTFGLISSLCSFGSSIDGTPSVGGALSEALISCASSSSNLCPFRLFDRFGIIPFRAELMLGGPAEMVLHQGNSLLFAWIIHSSKRRVHLIESTALSWCDHCKQHDIVATQVQFGCLGQEWWFGHDLVSGLNKGPILISIAIWVSCFLAVMLLLTKKKGCHINSVYFIPKRLLIALLWIWYQ